MSLKINNFFLLIILILLQSCSGGRIGNFLESSFRNIEEPRIKEDIKNNSNNKIVIRYEEDVEKNKNIEEPRIKENIKNNSNNKIVFKSGENVEKNKNIEETKIKEDIKNNSNNKVVKKLEKKLKNNKDISDKNIFRQKRQYQPQSYKIIFILKDVDPKDPIEDLSTILRNFDVNFEIEKIERFFDTKNKSIKKN